jgi:hypothetical protein
MIKQHDLTIGIVEVESGYQKVNRAEKCFILDILLDRLDRVDIQTNRPAFFSNVFRVQCHSVTYNRVLSANPLHQIYSLAKSRCNYMDTFYLLNQ